MARLQQALTTQLKIYPLVDTVKVLDYLKVNDDGSENSYTMVIENLLEESETFRQLRELQREIEQQQTLRKYQSTSNDDLWGFSKKV